VTVTEAVSVKILLLNIQKAQVMRRKSC